LNAPVTQSRFLLVGAKDILLWQIEEDSIDELA
jgi:hypothetical protein